MSPTKSGTTDVGPPSDPPVAPGGAGAREAPPHDAVEANPSDASGAHLLRSFNASASARAGFLACLILPIAILFASVAPAAGQSAPEAAAAGNAAQAPEGQEAPAAAELEDEKESDAEQPLESKLWERFEALKEGLGTGEKTAEDADALYQALVPVLDARRLELRDALEWARRVGDPLESGPRKKATVAALAAAGAEPIPDTATVQDLFNAFLSLYDLRLALLRNLTPQLRRSVTGAGLTGIRALRGEIDAVIIHFRFIGLQMRDELDYWRERTIVAPLLLIGGVLELVVAVLVFYWWRRWAAREIPRWRSRLLEARPRRRYRLRLARFLWYLDQVRSPLEWLLLASVFYAVIGFRNVPFFDDLVWPLPRWALLAWFVVAFLNAIASRGGKGLLGGEAPGLGLRSLRLVTAWVLLLGFGLELASIYAGRGTFHAWVWGVFEFLTLPVLLLLIVWWRPEVFRQFDEEPQLQAWVQRTIRHRTGLRSYWGAAIGGVYLIGLRLVQHFLQWLSEVERGRRFLATLSRHRASPGTGDRRQIEDREPIPAALRDRLLGDNGTVYEKAGRAQLAELVELVESGRGGLVAVVAEQGSGKSLLLERLSSKCEGKVVVFDCPPGGYEALERAFANALGVRRQELTPAALRNRLQKAGAQAVAIDNLHRLFRPVMGGQKDLDRFAGLINDIAVRVLWVAALNKAAWAQISSARAHRLTFDRVLELPPWEEEQIGELIDLCSDEAGISPDFGQLVLPTQGYYAQYDTIEERNRAGTFRMIWAAADGNPKVALQFWADSLAVAEDGKIVVGIPPQPPTEEIEGAHFNVLLVLRVIARAELITCEDIIESLRLSEADVENAIYFLLGRGWIEEVDDRYRLNPAWYRAVTRVLARKHLLSH